MKITPLAKPGKAPKNRIKKEWLAFRRQWLKDNPPNHQGFYICGICGRPVSIEGVELDHVQNRSTHPHLRFDPENVRPAHSACNSGRKL